MQAATKAEYLRLAEHFYRTRLDGQPPSPKRVCDALKAVAGEYRPDYWRRLRRALVTAQEAAGYPEAAERIGATKNPATKDRADWSAVKKKQSRTKGVKPEDADKLAAFLEKRGDRAGRAVLTLCRHLGCRPAEVAGIEIDDLGNITIQGAKSRTDRGISTRRIRVTGPVQIEVMNAKRILEAVAGEDLPAEIGRVQDRIARAGRKLWPRRKSVPSLYSFRHQVGSDLKASGYSRVEIAYTMGHRSTQSVDVYGDRRKASGGTKPEPAWDADMSAVRENHSEYSETLGDRQGNSAEVGFDGPGAGM